MSEIPAFVILLEEDKQRVDHVNNVLLNQVPNCKIWPATDWRIHKEFIDEFIQSGQINIEPRLRPRFSLGSIACLISHLRLWKHIVEHKIEKAVVFEDDAIALPEYQQRIGDIVGELPDDTDFVFLYIHDHQYNPSRETIPGKSYLVPYYYTWGTVSYLLTLKGAQKLVSLFESAYNPVDEMINDAIAQNHLVTYMVKERITNTIGQKAYGYNGESLRSNIWGSQRLA